MELKKLSEFDFNEIADSFKNLDPQNIGSWPIVVRAVIFIGAFALVLFLANYLFINELNNTLARENRNQGDLLKEFEDKHHKAKNLDQYKQQLAEMDASFGALLRQLPSDTEVPGLLEDITHTGLGAGLDFDEIQLRPEVAKEFYIELPINIKARGDYHSFAAFVSGVAALPRIVTLHDFKISRNQGKSGGKKGSSGGEADDGLLYMEIVAKTYRYKAGEEGAK